MGFDLNQLKEDVRDTLRLWLYPECLEGTNEYTLSTTINFEIAQSFIPYSRYYRKVDPYKNTIPVILKLRKYETPNDGLVISLQSDDDNSPSGSTLGSHTAAVGDITSTLGVYTSSIPITNMLGSNTKYWIVISPQNTASTVNYYSVGINSVDTEYWIGTSQYKQSGSIWTDNSVDLYFDASIPNYIYEDYPRDDLSLFSLPRIAVDIIGRRTNQRWINRKLSEYYLDLTVVAYSRFPEELDDMLSYVDRALFKERIDIGNIKRIDPGELTPVVVIRENMFSRALRYSLIYKMVSD